ncbi:TusE/DsrC/DsvC family sulfur relay protein [Candidatus Venteria ishoeyi]|uniref:Sulfurtransferase n=1 Tax=Candidatus Venteria ishoeyi TaxID=1899563 RepID=A0A1H6F650_9GAMM|nr:TusE/DsrC/DsvC family sulfur relay protein [Candidatus Venteria ishoeyi]MDM8547498.1 TusE/DsrC/DsvC family sulfur relay protein [Candidatus Venteria ishoeyi]SEH05648.1 Sulfurtransferase TusE [Candidatus Venteria ishoeyi]
MSYELDGKTIETTANGYLVEPQDWSEGLAEIIAAEEDVALTERHWDLINYLRSEYLENNGNQPNTRNLQKAMKEKWGEKVDAKALYILFPKDPSKQGGRIAGVPESRRKGGY